MTRLLALLLLTVIAMPMPARAGTAVNGARLKAWCESSNVDEISTCLGYILSVGDILNDQKIYEGRACIPVATSADEMRQLVVLFLRTNPQLLDTASGANLAALAMIHAYPCSSS
ncbi:MAG: hypothetical protein J0H82_15165 [Alphaproteobacteria bacterium]|jgi:hypothetical protein|nr:hypothetical protein [Alphaproteobacteria bacterium]